MKWFASTDLLKLFKDEGTHDAIANNQGEEADVGKKERGKGACVLPRRNHNASHKIVAHVLQLAF